jgi:TetR/AcrR family transcriptional repressor of mexJK operon
MELGYGAASMDAVAARAGVSKATIYVHYASKRALFEAIIRRRAESVTGRFSVPQGILDLRQSLLGLAHNFIDMLLTPEALAMYRVVLAEATQQPEIGAAFYQAGPAYARRKVGEFFQQLAGRGLLAMEPQQAPIAGDLFLAMLANDSHMRALFGVDADAAAEQLRIEAAIDMFMARYGQPAAPHAS